MATKIAMDEWLSALQKISTKNADGVSTREMCAASGHDLRWVRERLRAAIESGTAAMVGYRIEPAIDGRQAKIPVYRFRKK